MVTIAPGITATPDRRYAHGVPTGTAAELLGLGPAGLRWPQLLVIALGLTISNNLWAFRQLEFSSVLGPFFLFSALLGDAFFLLAAITAVRSVQNAVGVAVMAGIICGALSMAWLLAQARMGLIGPIGDGPLSLTQRGTLMFLWPFLTLLAVQFAAAGEARWLRLLTGLFAGSLVSAWVANTFYVGGESAIGYLLSAPFLLNAFASDVVFTAALWLGWSRFGRRAG